MCACKSISPGITYIPLPSITRSGTACLDPDAIAREEEKGGATGSKHARNPVPLHKNIRRTKRWRPRPVNDRRAPDHHRSVGPALFGVFPFLRLRGGTGGEQTQREIREQPSHRCFAPGSNSAGIGFPGPSSSHNIVCIHQRFPSKYSEKIFTPRVTTFPVYCSFPS